MDGFIQRRLASLCWFRLCYCIFNPHGSTGYGSKYTEAISKDWGGKVYEDVMKVTDALTKLSYVDSNKIGAMGWSYGGYMMNWLQGQTKSLNALPQ